MNVPLAFTFLYFIMGLVVLKTVVLNPAGTTSFSAMMRDMEGSEIPEEVRSVIIFLVALFLLMFWPAILIEALNK